MSKDLCFMCNGDQEFEGFDAYDRPVIIRCHYCVGGLQRPRIKKTFNTQKAALEAAIAVIERELK